MEEQIRAECKREESVVDCWKQREREQRDVGVSLKGGTCSFADSLCSLVMSDIHQVAMQNRAP